MNAVQSNTREGPLPIVAGESLVDKSGYLVKLVNDTGVLKALLPTANTDVCLFVVEDEAANAATAAVRPIYGNSNVRIKAKGTGNPGDLLVLADVGTAADKGKVRAATATMATSFVVGYAEETFVDGQFVRVRPAIGVVSSLNTSVGRIFAAGTHTWVGGAATDSIPVVGLESTDHCLVSLTAQAATELLQKGVNDAANDQIDLTLSAAGTAGTTKVAYIVIRP